MQLSLHTAANGHFSSAFGDHDYHVPAEVFIIIESQLYLGISSIKAMK